MSRHKPTAHELDELAAAWRAYLDDEPNAHDRLSDAVRRVLGRPKTANRIALDNATPVRIDDLPIHDRSFGER